MKLCHEKWLFSQILGKVECERQDEVKALVDQKPFKSPQKEPSFSRELFLMVKCKEFKCAVNHSGRHGKKIPQGRLLQRDHVPLVDSDAGILSVRTKSAQEPPDHPREVAYRENPDETESADVEEVGVGVLLVLHLLQPADSATRVGRELVELVQDDADWRDQA